MRGATFVSVASADDEYDIQSIIPQVPAGAWDPVGGDWGEGGPFEWKDGIFQIMTINVSDGSTEHAYDYCVPGKWSTVEKAGWYENGELVNKKFVQGEAFLLSCPWVVDGNDQETELATAIQCAGEVKLAAKTVENSESGYWLRENYRPIATDIQKLVPYVPENAWDPVGGDWGEGGPFEWKDGIFQIMTINVSDGSTEHAYDYCVPGKWSTVEKAGWYENGELVEKELVPGEGFLLSAPWVVDSGDQETELATGLTFQE